jgi:hypothetical protein
MSESEVRAKLEKAAATARNIAAQKGKGDVSQDAMRRQMEKHAEQDKKEGKI